MTIRFWHCKKTPLMVQFLTKLGQKLDRGHQLKSELNILLALVAAVWSRTFFQNTSVILFMLTINKIVPVSIALHILKWHWPFLISRFDQGVFQWMNKKRFLYCSWLVRIIEISSLNLKKYSGAFSDGSESMGHFWVQLF